jgi:Domain of unknown function (DUF5060)/Cna protein B-type domain
LLYRPRLFHHLFVCFYFLSTFPLQEHHSMKPTPFFVAASFIALTSVVNAADVQITGDLNQWHKTTLLLTGPASDAKATPNPFLDYRFNVTFTSPTGKAYNVPGYFAGDGNGGGTGNKWAAHLNPHEIGKWTYKISFRSGNEVAVATVDTAGTAVALYDGATGDFTVAPSTKSGNDFRAPDKGMLVNRGNHYLTYSNGKPFVHVGTGIPENLLGYRGFTNTTVGMGHTFATHVADWKTGDPDWLNADGGNGKAIIGMFNYLAQEGANSVYFMSNTLNDDGKDTFPHLEPTAIKAQLEPSVPAEWAKLLRYDLLKLKQWDIALGHAQSKGIFFNWHFAEHQNLYLYGGAYADAKIVMTPHRKLYFRMMIACFGHYNGVLWNLGEECDWTYRQFTDQLAYINAIDPYQHPATFQAGGAGQPQEIYSEHLGNVNLDSATFQSFSYSRDEAFVAVQKWRNDSAAKGVPITVILEEPQKIENNDKDTVGYPYGRREKMWPWMMSGGDGFQWYVQQSGGGHDFDQKLDDMSLMKTAHNWSRHVRDFVLRLPVLIAKSSMDIVTSTTGDDFTMYKDGDIYGIYNTKVGTGMTLDLTGKTGNFTVQWFDPRSGGALQNGTVTNIAGGSKQALGNPPKDTNMDWAVLVTRVGFDPGTNVAPTVNAGSKQTIFLKDKATLTGLVTDDGLPAPSTLNITWTMVSGPSSGVVTFVNNKSASTQASFSHIGLYKLRLTASDGALSNTSDVEVQVNANPTGNTAPNITLAPSVISLWKSATQDELLDATVSDDGLPAPAKLTYTWSVVSPDQSNPSNPKATFATPNAVDTNVKFSAPGKYTLRLTVSDGALPNFADVIFDSKPAQPARPTVDDVTKIISGSGMLGATVTVYVDGVVKTTLKITKADGTWSYTVTGLPSGDHEVAYTITMNGSTSTESDGQTITGAAAGTNTAPVITLDAELITTWVSATTNVALTATVTDDGLPTPSKVTYEWKVVSPDQTVSTNPKATFATAAAEDTGVKFSAPGKYTISLTALDSALSSTEQIMVDVKPGKPGVATVDSSGASPVLSGTATVGSTITVTVDGTVHGTVTVTNVDGTWTYTVTGLATGDHNITYTVTSNGSTSVASDAQTVKGPTGGPAPAPADDGGKSKSCGLGNLSALLLMVFFALSWLGISQRRKPE